MNPVDVLEVVSKPQGNAIICRWANPRDTDFVGVKLYRKEGSAIIDQSDPDAVLIYDGSGEQIIDWGFDQKYGVLKNSVEYYYSVWTYDATPTYSTPVSKNTSPEYSIISDNVYLPTELKVIIKNSLPNKGINEFEIRETDSFDPTQLGEKPVILIHPMDDNETQRNIGDESHSEQDPDDENYYITYIGGLYEWSFVIRPVSLMQPFANKLYLKIKEILYEQWDRMTALGCVSRHIAGMGIDDDLSGSIIAKPIYSRPIRVTIGYDFLVSVKDPRVASVTANYAYV